MFDKPFRLSTKIGLYALALIIAYIGLQPNLFGPLTNTFGLGGDQHFLINPVFRHIQAADAVGDPLLRIWYGEFDIYHNPHFNARYPFYFFGIGEPGGYMETSRRAFLITHFHHIIGGIGAFVLALSIGVRPVAAFAAGLFFALCVNNTNLSPFYWRLAATAWTPWALAGIWLTCSGANRTLGILIAAPAVALLVFAKSAQPLLYFVVAAFFIGLAGIMKQYRLIRGRANWSRDMLISPTILGLLALALALPVFWPVFSGQSGYVRWTSVGPVVGSYKVPFHGTIEMAYPLKGLANLLVPLKNLPNIGSTFIGPLVVIIAGVALFAKQSRGLVLTMLGLAIYFIVNGLGDLTFIPHITHKVPMINNIRELPSHYILVNLAFVVLIAVAWNELAQAGRDRLKSLLLLTLTASILSAVLMFQLNDIFERHHILWSVLLIGSPLVVPLISLVSGRRMREGLLIVLAVALVLPSARLRENRVVNAENNRLYKDPISLDVQSAWKWVAERDPNAIVAANITKYRDGHRVSSTRAASLALYNGLRPFNIAMSPRPHAEMQHYTKIMRDKQKLVQRGLQYFVTNRSEDISTDRLRKVKAFDNITVYKVIDPMGRLKIKCEPQCQSVGEINTLTETNNLFNYGVNLPTPQKLEFYAFKNEHWNVEINGERVEPSWRGQDMITLDLPAGQHEVNFTYTVKKLKVLWSVFFIALLGYLFLLVQYIRGKRMFDTAAQDSEPVSVA